MYIIIYLFIEGGLPRSAPQVYQQQNNNLLNVTIVVSTQT